MKPNGLRMTESLVQGQLARRVRWGGCGNVRPERGATRRVLTQSLDERKCASRMAGVSLSYEDQCAELPECKEVRPELAEVPSQVLQDVVKRVDLAFDAFFRRLEEGEKPGYPVRRIVGSY